MIAHNVDLSINLTILKKKKKDSESLVRSVGIEGSLTDSKSVIFALRKKNVSGGAESE